MSKDGSLRYVALKSGEDTTLRAVRTSDGSVAMSQAIAGSFGVPMLTSGGPGGGLFRDGSTFVLQSTGYAANTTFQLVRAGDLALGDTIALKGTFAFDALSPDGSKLYLIQHTSVNDLQHYVVRAYDLGTHTLLPGKIADKTQKGWVMQGFPVARATTADGRWAYTMYWNPNGVPVRARARHRERRRALRRLRRDVAERCARRLQALGEGRQADDPGAQRRAVPRHRPDDVEGDEAVRNVSIAAVTRSGSRSVR